MALQEILKQFDEIYTYPNTDRPFVVIEKELKELILKTYEIGKRDVIDNLPKIIEPPKIEAKITKRQYYMDGQMNILMRIKKYGKKILGY